MASQDYDEWNKYLINKFFLESSPDSCIRLNVYPEWFNRVPVLDGMGGLLDFLAAMSAICEDTICPVGKMFVSAATLSPFNAIICRLVGILVPSLDHQQNKLLDSIFRMDARTKQI